MPYRLELIAEAAAAALVVVVIVIVAATTTAAATTTPTTAAALRSFKCNSKMLLARFLWFALVLDVMYNNNDVRLLFFIFMLALFDL